MLTKTADRLLNDGGRVFGPDKGRRMTVPVVNVRLNVADQCSDSIERAAPDRLACENSEPGLHHVEPGRTLGREVKLDVRVLREPGLDRRRRMGGEIGRASCRERVGRRGGRGGV